MTAKAGPSDEVEEVEISIAVVGSEGCEKSEFVWKGTNVWGLEPFEHVATFEGVKSELIRLSYVRRALLNLNVLFINVPFFSRSTARNKPELEAPRFPTQPRSCLYSPPKAP